MIFLSFKSFISFLIGLQATSVKGLGLPLWELAQVFMGVGST